MFDNFIFGPVAGYLDREDIRGISKDMLDQGYTPLFASEKGEFFNNIIKGQTIGNKPIKGVIFSMGFKTLYND
jgi:hypothetical protein